MVHNALSACNVRSRVHRTLSACHAMSCHVMSSDGMQAPYLLEAGPSEAHTGVQEPLADAGVLACGHKEKAGRRGGGGEEGGDTGGLIINSRSDAMFIALTMPLYFQSWRTQVSGCCSCSNPCKTHEPAFVLNTQDVRQVRAHGPDELPACAQASLWMNQRSSSTDC